MNPETLFKVSLVLVIIGSFGIGYILGSLITTAFHHRRHPW